MKVGVVIICLFYSSFLLSQKEIAVDSTLHANVEKTPKDTVKRHSPLKAALFSAVIPGAGQVYNTIARKKPKNAIWKVPLIYAGLGTTGYFMIANQLKQKSIKKEYLFRESTNFTQIGENKWSQYDASSLISLHEKYLNQRDLFILGMGIVYLLQVADAAVEAHFVKFDVSEDLTLQFRPAFIPTQTNQQPTIGLKLALNFKK